MFATFVFDKKILAFVSPVSTLPPLPPHAAAAPSRRYKIRCSPWPWTSKPAVRRLRLFFVYTARPLASVRTLDSVFLLFDYVSFVLLLWTRHSVTMMIVFRSPRTSLNNIIAHSFSVRHTTLCPFILYKNISTHRSVCMIVVKLCNLTIVYMYIIFMQFFFFFLII